MSDETYPAGEVEHTEVKDGLGRVLRTDRVRLTTCLEPAWDDGVRVRCSMGTAGKCARHGPHRPHPDDGRPCDPMDDGYCRTHGVYVDPYAHPEASA